MSLLIPHPFLGEPFKLRLRNHSVNFPWQLNNGRTQLWTTLEWVVSSAFFVWRFCLSIRFTLFLYETPSAHKLSWGPPALPQVYTYTLLQLFSLFIVAVNLWIPVIYRPRRTHMTFHNNTQWFLMLFLMVKSDSIMLIWVSGIKRCFFSLAWHHQPHLWRLLNLLHAEFSMWIKWDHVHQQR